MVLSKRRKRSPKVQTLMIFMMQWIYSLNMAQVSGKIKSQRLKVGKKRKNF